MAQTVSEPGPLFTRVTDRGRTSAWKAAVPAVVVLVAIVIALAYLASKVSSYSQQAASARQEAEQARQQLDATQKRMGVLDHDMALAKNPGRTTFLIEGKQKNVKAWSAATWGELPDGKTWMRLLAYGFAAPADKKEYGVWFVPKDGAPALVGHLEPAQDGSAYLVGENLPAIGQGKQILISLEDENAKQPGQPMLSADLPKLEPSKATTAAQDQAAQPAK